MDTLKGALRKNEVALCPLTVKKQQDTEEQWEQSALISVYFFFFCVLFKGGQDRPTPVPA